MLGGSGHDTYYVDTPNDQVIENTAEGFDLVISTVSITGLAEHVEDLTFSEQAGPSSGTGNALANVITGNGFTNTLSGLGGADDLRAEDGDDVLLGGAGADWLRGGAGIDVARYDDSGTWVYVDLATGNGLNGDAAGDALISIENVVGSAYGDELIGSA